MRPPFSKAVSLKTHEIALFKITISKKSWVKEKILIKVYQFLRDTRNIHIHTYIHTYIHIYIHIYIYNLYQMKGIFTQIKCFQKFILKDVISRGCDVFMVYFNWTNSIQSSQHFPPLHYDSLIWLIVCIVWVCDESHIGHILGWIEFY